MTTAVRIVVTNGRNNIIYHIILLYEDISDLYSDGKYSSLLWKQQDKPDYDQSLDSFRKAVSH